jgi:hypothetical protein
MAEALAALALEGAFRGDIRLHGNLDVFESLNKG